MINYRRLGTGFSKTFLYAHMKWGGVGRNMNAIRKDDAVAQMMELQESDRDGRLEFRVDCWGDDRPYVFIKEGNKVTFMTANGKNATRFITRDEK